MLVYINLMKIIVGENCELDIDVCLNELCFLLRNCMDFVLEEEVWFGWGFNCIDCFLGYKDIENKCEGNIEK